MDIYRRTQATRGTRTLAATPMGPSVCERAAPVGCAPPEPEPPVVPAPVLPVVLVDPEPPVTVELEPGVLLVVLLVRWH